MVLLNNSNFYAYSYNNALDTKKDEVEIHIDFLKDCNDYDEVKDYLVQHFGDVHGEHWVEFENCNKECYLKLDDTKIEFCSLKNHKQYYGKGWAKINND